VGHFTRALGEAVLIDCRQLRQPRTARWRGGRSVAFRVLAITFVVMDRTGISLQRISLVPWFIRARSLVDDAIIAVERMIRKLEEGFDRFKAAGSRTPRRHFPG